ncbi:hypothetical protein LOD99_4975 [Oopsacas minuta]|uniref:Wolframin cysteine-rich domain-containing protein n=1 Tax=Oopsacas minuta TaxID=111878 RepID=A0AAV7JSG5_9METZ|nr:hypothetical protein LOD99_4975 [Oopsacas minuta]
MSTNNDLQRSLSTLVEESINQNARLLFKRFQSPIQTTSHAGSNPQSPDTGVRQRKNKREEIVQSPQNVLEDTINVSDMIPGDGLRLRPRGGASNEVDGATPENEEDKILNANVHTKAEGNNDTQTEVVGKQNENVLNSFAEYKAEQEDVEMSQEFFVNSIKELLTGELGYVSQSIYADARKHNREEWKKFHEAPILNKVFNHPGMTINTIKESVIKNTQKYSITFLWRWVPYRELQFLLVLYFYSLLLLPEVLFTIIPTVISICIFLTMLVYSVQIISARLDFSEYLSIVDSLGFVDNIYKFVVASDYLRKTSIIYYIKFFFCWSLFLFVFPQVKTQVPAFFVPLSLIFFLASTYFALQVRQKVVYLSIAIWFIEFLTWSIGMLIGPSAILLAIGAVTKITHTLVFIYMACCYKWKGFTLLVCPHFFMAVWWKMFALSVMNLAMSQLVYIIIGTILVTTLLPFLTVLIIVFLAISPLATWYYYDINAALFVWAGLATAGIAVMLFGWFYDRLIKLDFVKLTFKNAMWLVFFMFSFVCFLSYAYSQYSFNSKSVIKWKDYSEFCSPHGGNQNFATYQHKCMHLVGRKVRLEGVIDNIYLESRDNSLERVISKIPFSPLVQGLTCLLGKKESYPEGCDYEKYPNLCQVGHCAMSLGEEFTYGIELGGKARTFSNTARISAGTKFKSQLLQLKKWDKVNLLCRIEEVGATTSKVKLLRIQTDDQPEEVSTSMQITNYLSSVIYFFLL